MIKRPTYMFLSEFANCDIKLNGHILEIDGKRYFYRGFYFITEIDIKKQVVYIEMVTNTENTKWFQESLPFKKVSLIPLFPTEKPCDSNHNLPKLLKTNDLPE